MLEGRAVHKHSKMGVGSSQTQVGACMDEVEIDLTGS